MQHRPDAAAQFIDDTFFSHAHDARCLIEVDGFGALVIFRASEAMASVLGAPIRLFDPTFLPLIFTEANVSIMRQGCAQEGFSQRTIKHNQRTLRVNCFRIAGNGSIVSFEEDIGTAEEQTHVTPLIRWCMGCIVLSTCLTPIEMSVHPNVNVPVRCSQFVILFAILAFAKLLPVETATLKLPFTLAAHVGLLGLHFVHHLSCQNDLVYASVAATCVHALLSTDCLWLDLLLPNLLMGALGYHHSTPMLYFGAVPAMCVVLRHRLGPLTRAAFRSVAVFGGPPSDAFAYEMDTVMRRTAHLALPVSFLAFVLLTQMTFFQACHMTFLHGMCTTLDRFCRHYLTEELGGKRNAGLLGTLLASSTALAYFPFAFAIEDYDAAPLHIMLFEWLMFVPTFEFALSQPGPAAYTIFHLSQCCYCAIQASRVRNLPVGMLLLMQLARATFSLMMHVLLDHHRRHFVQLKQVQ